ncbi:hypothetical protein ACIBF6_17605 [Streptosporangium amethystogenes]|uniref:hypothetical protein n=1 Tax=Streptosporangium amethystogenes TaxID=2002 RepID=UPI0037BBCE1B
MEYVTSADFAMDVAENRRPEFLAVPSTPGRVFRSTARTVSTSMPPRTQFGDDRFGQGFGVRRCGRRLERAVDDEGVALLVH